MFQVRAATSSPRARFDLIEPCSSRRRVQAAIDISDGLLQDRAHLGERSSGRGAAACWTPQKYLLAQGAESAGCAVWW